MEVASCTHESTQYEGPEETFKGFQSTLNNDYPLTEKLSKKTFKLQNPNQKVALLQRAGPYLSTKASHNYIVVLAGFPTKSELQQYVASTDLCMLTQIIPSCKFVYVGSKQESESVQLERVNTIINNTKSFYDEYMQKEKEYIKTRMSLNPEQQEDYISKMKVEAYEKNKLKKSLEENIEKTTQLFKEKYSNQTSINLYKQTQLQTQNFAVISVLRDPYKNLGPDEIEHDYAVAIWQLFNQQSEAEAYLSDYLQHHFPHYDSFIVPTNSLLNLEHTRTDLDDADKTYRFQVQTDTYIDEIRNQQLLEEINEKFPPKNEENEENKEKSESENTK